MPTPKTKQPSLRDLIKRSGLSLRKIAEKAGINKDTIVRCLRKGTWPKQRRVLNGLRLALGLPEA